MTDVPVARERSSRMDDEPLLFALPPIRAFACQIAESLERHLRGDGSLVQLGA